MMYFFTEVVHFVDGAYTVGPHLFTAWAFVFCRGGCPCDVLNLVSGFVLLIVGGGAEEFQDVIGVEF